MNALIVAAGLGTRLKPYTDTLPKALVPVDGRPMLEHQIVRLRDAGITRITVNVHHFAEQIIQWADTHAGRLGVDICISDERSLLLDTGGAVRQALTLLDNPAEPLLVHNVDIFSNADLRAFCAAHRADGAAASLLVSERPSSRQLLFRADDDGTAGHRLVGWLNRTTGQVKSPFAEVRAGNLDGLLQRAFAGIHILSPTLYADISRQPEVFSIIDYYLSAAATSDIRGIEAPPTFRLVDAGKPDTLPLAAALVAHSVQ